MTKRRQAELARPLYNCSVKAGTRDLPANCRKVPSTHRRASSFRELSGSFVATAGTLNIDNPKTSGNTASDTLIARCCRAIIKRWQKTSAGMAKASVNFTEAADGRARRATHERARPNKGLW